jgi:hypothetical protein
MPTAAAYTLLAADNLRPVSPPTRALSAPGLRAFRVLEEAPVPKVIVASRIEEEVKSEVARLAAVNERSLSDEIRLALDEHVAGETTTPKGERDVNDG